MPLSLETYAGGALKQHNHMVHPTLISVSCYCYLLEWIVLSLVFSIFSESVRSCAQFVVNVFGRAGGLEVEETRRVFSDKTQTLI